jgi:Ni/Co efflux regulator RcnB
MKKVYQFLVISALSASLAGPMSFAQDHRDDHHDDHPAAGGHPAYVHHAEWKKGYHMQSGDWGRAQRIDYRQYHLNAPPRGYEWRSVDGNYVLAAVATGVIASVVVASAIH